MKWDATICFAGARCENLHVIIIIYFTFFLSFSLFLSLLQTISLSIFLSLSFSFFPFSSSLLSIFLSLSLFFYQHLSLCLPHVFISVFVRLVLIFLIPSSIWSVCLCCYLRKLSQSFLLLFCSKNHNCFTFFAPFVRILSYVVLFIYHMRCVLFSTECSNTDTLTLFLSLSFQQTQLCLTHIPR